MITKIQIGSAKFVALPLSLEVISATLRNGDNLEIFLENNQTLVLEHFFDQSRVLLANVDNGIEVEKFVFSDQGNIVGVETVSYDKVQSLLGEDAVKELATQTSDVLLFSDPQEAQEMTAETNDVNEPSPFAPFIIAGVAGIIGAGIFYSERKQTFEENKENSAYFKKALIVEQEVISDPSSKTILAEKADLTQAPQGADTSYPQIHQSTSLDTHSSEVIV